MGSLAFAAPPRPPCAMLSTAITNNNSNSSSSQSDSLFRSSSSSHFSTRPPVHQQHQQQQHVADSATAGPADAQASSSAAAATIASSTNPPPRPYPSQHAASFSSICHDSHSSMTSHSSPAHRLPDRQRPSSHRPHSTQPQHYSQSQPDRRSPNPERGSYMRSNLSAAPAQSSPSSPVLQPTYRSSRSLDGLEASSPSRIKVRDLNHIQSFASEEILSSSRDGTTNGRFPEAGRQYEISSMPVTDIIEMVAGVLTKITTTNDEQHAHLHRHIPPPEGASNLSPQTTSVLAFHGKNVPSITIFHYLTRIHKYCPATYEVFLSLLVYFDRMTETVNKGYIQSLQRRQPIYQQHPVPSPSPPLVLTPDRHSSHLITPPSSGGNTFASARVRQHQPPSPMIPGSGRTPSTANNRESIHGDHDDKHDHEYDEDDDDDSLDFSHYFVVDSYNIHRLVIAGVTCASKFFSDVFYTNSRYAKVGGLPLVELNHLELQFLLLNDFRLAIPVEELEAYGTMLVEFYAREVLTQRERAQQHQQQQHSHTRQPSSTASINAHAQAQAQAGTRAGETGYTRPSSVRRVSERSM